MKNFNEIEQWTPKKLRTLRNNLNNRIISFTARGGGKEKALQESHVLYGMSEVDCRELLLKVKKLISNK